MISIVIPVYNEAQTIDALIQNLEKLEGLAEILFVDGGSTDDTLLRIPEKYRILHGTKGRAVQMNLGAKESSGDVIFFLHCDCIIPEDALQEIEEVMAKYSVGCFGIQFNTTKITMKCCEYLSNRRIKRYKVVFGDQGIFMRRQLFFSIGGFPELPIMEDYQLSLNIRDKKIPIGMTKKKITTSDRRFVQGGPLRTMWKMYRLRAAYRRGVDINTISKKYKDIR